MQVGLFGASAWESVEAPNASVWLRRGFLSATTADSLLASLVASPWRQDQIQLFGKTTIFRDFNSGMEILKGSTAGRGSQWLHYHGPMNSPRFELWSSARPGAGSTPYCRAKCTGSRR